MEGLSAKDLKLFRGKSRAFCGTFRVSLDKLQYEELPNNPRQFDVKNAARLLDIFHKQGCRPRESDNHVPALVSRSSLPEACLNAEGDLPLLNPNHPLTYLHGRHRLEAAHKFLTGNDRFQSSIL
jgi:hypothetical protein